MSAERKVSLTYIGRRPGKKGTLWAFLKGKKEIYYGRIPGVVIGCNYEATEKDGSTMLAKYPKRLESSDFSDEQVAQWEARDLEVQETLDRKQDERKQRQAGGKLGPIVDMLYAATKGFTMRERAAVVRQLLKRTDSKAIDEEGTVRL
jgi:hypothetical protein